MPPAMRAAGGDYDDETRPEGIPVAMGVLRNGPIESDDEDEGRRNTRPRTPQITSPEQEPLNSERRSREDSTDDSGDVDTPHVTAVPGATTTERGTNETSQTSQPDVDDDLPIPDVPRKSSKRDSWKGASQLQQPEPSRPANLDPSTATTSRLPFERTPSQKRLSGSSAGLTDEFTQVDLQDSNSSTPAGYGFVNQGSVNRVDHEVDLLGSSAEVVDERR